MANQKDPHYKKLRRNVNKWVGLAETFAVATTSTEDDQWAVFLADLVTEHFDEAYDIRFPAKK